MKKILTIGLAILLSLCTCIGATACKPIKITTKEDLIPETLGEAEGLYLYYDNYRSFTDGSNTERLLNDITVDGVTYTTDEYYIGQIEYMTDKKEIFYSIRTQKENEEEKYFLWHYNYDTKESGLIRDLGAKKCLSLDSSEEYLSVNVSSGRLLYDGDLNLVLEVEGYRFEEGVLCDTGSSFRWWKDGRFYSLPINGGRVEINKEYAYLFFETCVYAIDLVTGEYQKTDFEKGERFSEGVIDKAVFTNSTGETYFITYTRETKIRKTNEILKTGCRLWKVEEFKPEKICVFPKKYEVTFLYDSNEEYLCLSTNEKTLFGLNLGGQTMWVWPWHAYYDLQENKFELALPFETRIPERPERILQVGEYVFYVDYVNYGLIMPEPFYYLHRVKDGKDEIISYGFPDEDLGNWRSVLFDDIHIR